MKTYKLIFAAAMLSVLACSKEQTPAGNTDTSVNGPSDVVEVFSFNAVTDNETKASIGVNENSKPQTFWENGDQITVYSAAAAEGYLFSTNLSEKAVSATFSHEGSFVTSDEYMAIHPAAGSGFSFDALSVSGVVVPAEQTLLAGSFDKTAAVSMAYSAGETTLPFKNATALVKFQVADERVVAGSVAVSDGEKIAGTFTAALDSQNAMAPVLTAEGGASSVEFKIDGTTKLSTETDYYVSVAPTALAGGFAVTVANAGGSYIKKTYDVESLERNKIYNVGTMTSNEHVSKIELNFNFADRDAMEGWNEISSAQTLPQNHIFNGEFTLNGQTYTHQLMQASDDNDNFWPYLTENATNKYLVLQGANRVYLPSVEGFKLVEVSIFRLAGNTSHATGITTECEPVANRERTYVTGGEAKKTSKNAWNTWNLTGTAANTSYWIFQAGGGTNSITMTNLKLTYEKVSE